MYSYIFLRENKDFTSMYRQSPATNRPFRHISQSCKNRRRIYCFQKAGTRMVKIVNISRRPVIIRKERNHLERAGTSA